VQNRTIKKGDTLALLVEDSGPGAMFTELGRTCVLGKVPQAMKDELEFVKESRKLTLDMLKPGTPLQGYLGGIQRVHAQERPPRGGAALLPRPGLRSGRAAADPQRRALDHPEGHEHRRASDLRARGYLNWLCDNYIIGGNGPGDRIHQFPEEIVEIDV
jgi:hypothetical protein